MRSATWCSTSSRSPTSRPCSPPRPARRPSTANTPFATTWWRSARRRATTRGSSSAPAPAPRCCSSAPPRRSPPSRDVTTLFPTTSRRSPPRSSSIACCSPPEPPGRTAERWWRTQWSESRRSEAMLAARGTLLLAAALMLGAAAFASPALYVPGIALALLVGGAALWVGLVARRALVERVPGPWTVVEGEPYPLDVVVRAGRLPLPGGLVTHPLAERSAPIGTCSPIRTRLQVSSLRRGRQVVAPVTLRLADPLGLRTTELRGGDADHVLVLPRIEPVVVRRPAGAGKGESLLDGFDGLGAAGLDTKPIGFEMDGLRPYRQGSPASRIHWPTVARSREMVEHRLVSGASATP